MNYKKKGRRIDIIDGLGTSNVLDTLNGMRNFIVLTNLFDVSPFMLTPKVQGFVLRERETGLSLFFIGMSNKNPNEAYVLIIKSALSKYSRNKLLGMVPPSWLSHEGIRLSTETI